MQENCKICSSEIQIHRKALLEHWIKEASEGPHEFFQVTRNPKRNVQNKKIEQQRPNKQKS